MTDPFIIQLPGKLASDPEVRDYFNFLNKVLHDLTAVSGDAIDDNDITDYSPHESGSTTVTSAAATDLDTTAAALDKLVDEVTTLQSQVNSILAQLRDDGKILP